MYSSVTVIPLATVAGSFNVIHVSQMLAGWHGPPQQLNPGYDVITEPVCED